MTPEEYVRILEQQAGEEYVRILEQQAGLDPKVEGPGVIVRVDDYTLSIDGIRIPATEDQEQRIRALTPEQRNRFMTVVRDKMPPWVEQFVPSMRVARGGITFYDKEGMERPVVNHTELAERVVERYYKEGMERYEMERITD